MKDFAIESTLCLVAFYLIYVFILKQERTFAFIRVYLLAALLFSCLLPFVEIPLYLNILPEEISPQQWHYEPQDMEFPAEVVSNAGQDLSFPTKAILPGLYFIGVAFMSFRFIRNLYKIYKLKSDCQVVRKSNIIFALSNSSIQTFSFFSVLFLNKRAYERGPDADLIHHEEAHIHQGHSFDLLFAELLMIIFWYQPFLYLYRKAIALNHEYIADEYAAAKSAEPSSYYLSKILEASRQGAHFSLASSFSFISIKKRIKMITNQNKRTSVLKPAFAGLMTISILLLFAFNVQSQDPALNEEFVVVLDAGHGGEDPGATSVSGALEKDITLAIVDKIAEGVSDDQNFKIITTRPDDRSLSLEERVKQTKQADLFISVHAESHEDPEVNFAMTIFSDRSFHSEKSNQVANLIAYEFEKRGKQGRVAYSDYFVLENSLCPAVIVSVGFLSNSADDNYIKSTDGQQKIAEGIADAIRLAVL